MIRTAFVALVALGLTSCSLHTNNSSICSTPAPLDPSGNSDQAAKTQSCIHRWAYRLAVSQDDANEVAQAVMGACQDAVDASIVSDRLAIIHKHPTDKDDPANFYEGQQAVKDDGTAVFEYKGDSKGWVSVTKVDDEYRRAKYKEIALFHVVQARAGKCKVP